jgi:hypothetical protein
MKLKSVTKLLLGAAIAFSAATVISQPSNACPEGQSSCAPDGHIDERNIFFCDRSHGVPTTAVRTPGGVMPVIRWVSHFFLPSGYDPYARCQDVSARFQTYYNNGMLDYITTGIVNRQPVVCVTDTTGGPCQGILFTLKPGQNASRIIEQLFDIRAGASGPLYESNSRVYLDMNKYLRKLGVANAKGVTSNTRSQW